MEIETGTALIIVFETTGHTYPSYFVEKLDSGSMVLTHVPNNAKLFQILTADEVEHCLELSKTLIAGESKIRIRPVKVVYEKVVQDISFLQYD